MKSDRFPCVGCGACCRRMDIALAQIKALGLDVEFPYKVTNGTCEMLAEDNTCKVYNDRPDICNIDKMIELCEMDKDQAYIATANECNRYMEQDGIKNFITL